MKKFSLALTLTVLGLFALAAEETVLFASDFKPEKKGYNFWAAKGMTTSNQVKDGKAFLEVKESAAEKQNVWNVQFSVVYAKGFTAGVNYRVTATVVSSSDFTVESSVSLNKAPWTTLARVKTDLKANQPAQIELKFIPKEDIADAYRIPVFALGNAPAGTVIEVTDVKLVEIK